MAGAQAALAAVDEGELCTQDTSADRGGPSTGEKKEQMRLGQALSIQLLFPISPFVAFFSHRRNCQESEGAHVEAHGLLQKLCAQ